MSILIADIDEFASVNYDLGYQVGDEILRQHRHRAPGGRVARRSVPHLRHRRALLRRGVRAPPARDRASQARRPSSRACATPIAVAPSDARQAASCRCRSASRASPTTPPIPRACSPPPRPRCAAPSAGGPGRVHFFSAGDADLAHLLAARSTACASPRSDRFRPYQERMNEVTSILHAATARCRACSSISRACTASSSISASPTTARSTTTPPPSSIACAATSSIPPI